MNIAEKIDITKLYTDHDWGMYKFNNISRITALKLIKLSDKHPDNVCLCWQLDRKNATADTTLFNLRNINFYLYYYKRDCELSQELDDDNELPWNDSDCYTLSDDVIAKFMKSTSKTKQLIQSLLKLDEEFKTFIYEQIKLL
jgi:hypothetical protein